MIETLPKFVVIVGAVIVAFLTIVVASAIVSRVFVSMSIRRLVNSIGRFPLPAFTSELAVGLPEPIQRYLHFALKQGQPNIRYAVIRQYARFRHGEERPWFTVNATEYLSGMEPGFVWDAVLRHNKVWWRTAILSYVNGKGSGRIKLFGALTIQEVDGAETDASMLFRLLSEQVWLPTGLLPTRTLRWQPIDAHKAMAIITDGSTTVTATFHVNDIGEIVRITTTDKYRDLKSGFEQTQFTLLCRDYREVDGIMIPHEVDFVWNLPKGDFTYGEFVVDNIRFHYV